MYSFDNMYDYDMYPANEGLGHAIGRGLDKIIKAIGKAISWVIKHVGKAIKWCITEGRKIAEDRKKNREEIYKAKQESQVANKTWTDIIGELSSDVDKCLKLMKEFADDLNNAVNAKNAARLAERVQGDVDDLDDNKVYDTHEMLGGSYSGKQLKKGAQKMIDTYERGEEYEKEDLKIAAKGFMEYKKQIVSDVKELKSLRGDVSKDNLKLGVATLRPWLTDSDNLYGVWTKIEAKANMYSKTFSIYISNFGSVFNVIKQAVTAFTRKLGYYEGDSESSKAETRATIRGIDRDMMRRRSEAGAEVRADRREMAQFANNVARTAAGAAESVDAYERGFEDAYNLLMEDAYEDEYDMDDEAYESAMIDDITEKLMAVYQYED